MDKAISVYDMPTYHALMDAQDAHDSALFGDHLYSSQETEAKYNAARSALLSAWAAHNAALVAAQGAAR